MNIVVKTASGKVIVRPDTTWERDNEDVYLPEFVDRVTWSPVLFARVSKPGRSVSAKFADRYYDGIGFGVLLYPENMIDGSEDAFAAASCLDHTSFLPFPVYNKLTLGRENNVFEVKRDGEVIYSCCDGTQEMILNAIEEVTRYCYIRIGDIIAIELQPRKDLCAREDGTARLTASWCGNETTDFKIIL